jgi:hypothetical protein
MKTRLLCLPCPAFGPQKRYTVVTRIGRHVLPLPRLNSTVFFRMTCNTHDSGAASPLRFCRTLLFLLFVLLPTSVSLLQPTHARLAGLGILHKERVQLSRLHYRGQADLGNVFPVRFAALRRFIVVCSDEYRERVLGVSVPERVVGDLGGRLGLALGVEGQAFLREVDGAVSFGAVVLEEVVQLSEELHALSVGRVAAGCSLRTSSALRCSLPMARYSRGRASCERVISGPTRVQWCQGTHVRAGGLGVEESCELDVPEVEWGLVCAAERGGGG